MILPSSASLIFLYSPFVTLIDICPEIMPVASTITAIDKLKAFFERFFGVS